MKDECLLFHLLELITVASNTSFSEKSGELVLSFTCSTSSLIIEKSSNELTQRRKDIGDKSPYLENNLFAKVNPFGLTKDFCKEILIPSILIIVRYSALSKSSQITMSSPNILYRACLKLIFRFSHARNIIKW